MKANMKKSTAIALLGILVTGLAACSSAPVGSDPSLTAAQRDLAQREMKRPSAAPDGPHDTDETVIVESDLPIPFDQFSRWFAEKGASEFSVFMTGTSAVPPIRLVAQPDNGAARTDALTGGWRNAGDRRRLVFADGTSALEEITADPSPQRFQYEVWNITNDTGRYITYALSEFRFSGSEGGTRIRWEYAFRRRGWPDGWFISRFVHRDFKQFMEATLTAMQVQARAESPACCQGIAATLTDQR